MSLRCADCRCDLEGEETSATATRYLCPQCWNRRLTARAAASLKPASGKTEGAPPKISSEQSP